jgi:hypothetical protein
MVSTPPARSPILAPPPAPRFGAKEDEWNPYGPRTTRSAARKQRAQTPTLKSDAPASPLSPCFRESKLVSSLTDDADVFGGESQDRLVPPRFTSSSGTSISNGMLPTPSKTPKKRTRRIDVTPARVLFQSPLPPEATPSRKRRLADTFDLEEDSAHLNDFSIFTDSRDRMPEVDLSEDNPFYGPGVRNPDTAEALEKFKDIKPEDHKDGIFVTFRGKKMFRPFGTREGSPTPGVQSDLETDHVPDLQVKPRLLFPTESQRKLREQSQQQEVDYVGEEDLTDIEEPSMPYQMPNQSSGEHNIEPSLSSVGRKTDSSLDSSFVPLASPKSDISHYEMAVSSDIESRGSEKRHIVAPPNPFNEWRVSKAGVSTKRKKTGSVSSEDGIPKKVKSTSAS